MDIIFETITDTRIGPAPSIERFVNGWRAEETWMANSSNERQVVLSPEFPKIGDSFGPGFDNLQVISAKCRYFKGKDSIDETKRGRVLVDVKWETPGLNGSLPPPHPGLRFSRFIPGTTSQTVYAAITAEGDVVSPADAIANGSGVEKQFGTMVFEVYRYEDQNSFEPNALLQRMIELASDQKLNKEETSLPPLLGNGAPILLSAGQARYLSGRMDDNQGVVEIVHELAVAIDHIARWRVEDSEGKLVGDMQEARIYPDGDYAGLW